MYSMTALQTFYPLETVKLEILTLRLYHILYLVSNFYIAPKKAYPLCLF